MGDTATTRDGIERCARRHARIHLRAAAALAAGLALAPAAAGAQTTLRIAMTAADVPTTTGMPNNGFEGMRFLGYPIFEGLTLWDLTRSDVPATIRPGLAEKWTQDKADPTRWIFTLRRGVKFHDGSDFTSDAVIWNLERFYNPQSKQFETQGAAISRARNPWLKAWKKIDDFTVEITTNRPVSYFPYVITYTLIASPAQFAKTGSSWAEFAKAPAGTGPFKITDVKPRVSVELTKNPAYWDKARLARLDKVVLLPMPEATTRLAALRSGQVDWIEVPPPDAAASLKQAGFEVVTGVYPHVWPWVFNLDKADSPWKDVRVRQAANYCVDRDGLVKLLSGTAHPSVGFYPKSHPLFGKPRNAYGFDPAKSRALMKEAGFGPDRPVKAKVMISTSGSGQMLPLPMNEFLQQGMKQCGFDIAFEVVEWGAMLVAFRNPPNGTQSLGADALNISLVSSDVSRMAAWYLSANFPPNGANWGHWKNETFEGAMARIERSTDPKEIDEQVRKAHEQLVDDPPWLWIVHDGNPRAMTKKVKGFANAQSWFQDLTLLELK
jgi:peptide/nickel transport system substrate-binding protein